MDSIVVYDVLTLLLHLDIIDGNITPNSNPELVCSEYEVLFDYWWNHIA